MDDEDDNKQPDQFNLIELATGLSRAFDLRKIDGEARETKRQADGADNKSGGWLSNLVENLPLEDMFDQALTSFREDPGKFLGAALGALAPLFAGSGEEEGEGGDRQAGQSQRPPDGGPILATKTAEPVRAQQAPPGIISPTFGGQQGVMQSLQQSINRPLRAQPIRGDIVNGRGQVI